MRFECPPELQGNMGIIDILITAQQGTDNWQRRLSRQTFRRGSQLAAHLDIGFRTS
jgi:hypothetical protein